MENELKVKITVPVAGNIKYMVAVMENGRFTTIYYKDGYSPDFGFPISYKNNKYDSAVIGESCVYANELKYKS